MNLNLENIKINLSEDVKDNPPFHSKMSPKIAAMPSTSRYD
eukprot:CAMPEP_0114577370 /NCGR_PEP_ID=MMETSP0125-20121206/2044_1 /TAXON_ID=485358 ORGANISM="Aristerostoma sp., Strain ATCC 50986" /NCGR_SAMPLE_ID=MMETSP0125 /ASSEMBLY_ACC=CAM_ASM_000245 /LENGTH=40 /DNA_ID= /DNA_START= /DNA_END= /DNA_ORIENTATION=